MKPLICRTEAAIEAVITHPARPPLKLGRKRSLHG